MAASTCLHPYQGTRTIASEGYASLCGVERRGLGTITFSSATSHPDRLISTLLRAAGNRADDVLGLNVGGGTLDCGQDADPSNHM